jgi:hypothetical protein
MSAVDKVVTDMLDANTTGKNQKHTQTISLDKDTHEKLLNLSKILGVSKTSLASTLLIAAIKDASRKISTEGQTESPTIPAGTVASVSQQPRRKSDNRR